MTRAQARPRVGYLSGGLKGDNEANTSDILKESLRALGWRIGETLEFDERWASGNFASLPGSAQEFLARQLDVLVSTGTTETRTLQVLTQAAPDVFRARVERATAGPRWIVAGNYGRVRDLLWPRADTIVWLDYGFPLVLGRLTARTVRRAATGEVLWNGNREAFWEHCRLWSEKSLFHWLVKTYWT